MSETYPWGGGGIVSRNSKMLVLGGSPDELQSLTAPLGELYEVLHSDDLEGAIDLLQQESVQALCILGDQAANPQLASLLLESSAVLTQFPEGLAILDTDLQVLWKNSKFENLTTPDTQSLADQKFYEAFGMPEILGPDFAPFHTALATRQMAYTRLQVGVDTHLSLRVTPIFLRKSELPKLLVVMVRDISGSIQQQQKLSEVYHAGLELCDLSPGEIAEMTFEDRIEYLKARIIASTTDILKFNNLEIRLIDPATGRLNSLLVQGLRPEAAMRELYARPKENGVTGYVAFTGKSYLIDDTATDPLYLLGAEGARSSLTVPLIWHDQVMGTFNVESPLPKAFKQQDLEFLELFGREVSLAVNLLNLLVAQNATTADTSILKVLQEISRPTDEVLNEISWLSEQFNDQGSEVTDRLRLICRHTRDIKQLIQNVREQLTPESSLSSTPSSRSYHPLLRGKRILVADSEESIRQLAYEVLAPHGCLVETARNGEEALRLVRQFEYDAVLGEMKLPDMGGHQLLCGIWDIDETLPFFLTTGFGYDAGHSLVKARQRGLTTEVLWKPFKVNRLLEELDKVFAQPRMSMK